MTNKFCGFDTAVVVDVETTGLNSRSERIVSIAMTRADFTRPQTDPGGGLDKESMYLVVNPQRSIPYQASRVHGFTNADVADKGTFGKNAQRLRDFIGNYPLIAHNIRFDLGFLNAEFERAGVGKLVDNKTYCTMQRFMDLYNYGSRQGSNLDAVARFMKVQGRKQHTHDAMEDVLITFSIAAQFYMIDNGVSNRNNLPKVSARHF